MLLTTHNPESQTVCPTCNKLVHCYNIGGVTFGSMPYLDFLHEECGTYWRYLISTGKIQTPIPDPPKQYPQADGKPTMSKEKIELLESLMDMVNQYCSRLDGERVTHDFIPAPEKAISILIKAGLAVDTGDGSNFILLWDKLEDRKNSV